MVRGSARAEGCSSERAGVPLCLVSDPAEGCTSVAVLVEGVGKGGWQGSAGGGGGAPHHRLLATPPGAGLFTRRLLEARASVCARASPQAFGPALSVGARRGAVQAGSPRGWLSCAWPQSSRGCFLRGSCRFMAQGARGSVQTLAPGGSCWLSLGGGGMRFRVFWEASYLPWQNPGGLFALGNPEAGELVPP